MNGQFIPDFRPADVAREAVAPGFGHDPGADVRADAAALRSANATTRGADALVGVTDKVMKLLSISRYSLQILRGSRIRL